MRTRLAASIAAPIVLLPATPAIAGGGPFIEITVSVCEFAGEPGDLGSANATLVFDASAPPVSDLPVGITFDAVSAELWLSADANCDDAFVVPTAEVSPLQVGTASLFYSTTGQSLLLVIESLDESISATVLVSNASAGFFAGMTSLPDAPGEYAPVAPRDDLAMTAEAPGLEVQAAWNAGTGFDRGRVRMTARLADAPAGEACNEADLALPFGVLDFSDALAFLTAFAAGCP